MGGDEVGIDERGVGVAAAHNDECDGCCCGVHVRALEKKSKGSTDDCLEDRTTRVARAGSNDLEPVAAVGSLAQGREVEADAEAEVRAKRSTDDRAW